MGTKKSKGQSHTLGIIIIILVVLAMLTYALSGFLTDWQWFKEVNYVSVFFTEIVTKLKIGVPGFLIFSVLGYLVFNAFKASFLKKNHFVILKEDKKAVRRSIVGISGALGLFIAIMLVGSLWFEFLQYINASEFGITDPLFGNDIGFYMFKYDFLEGLANSSIAIVIAFFAATVLLYGILVGFAKSEYQVERAEEKAAEEGAQAYGNDGQPREKREAVFFDTSGGFHIDPNEVKDRFTDFKRNNIDKNASTKAKFKAILNVASGELITLGVLFFLFVGFRLYLQQFAVLYDETGLFYGAGFTEVKVDLLVYRILMVLSIVAAILIVVAVKKKSLKLAVIIPIAMAVIGVAGNGVHALVQNVIVDPDELSKERSYMSQNIEYTQLAYDLDNVSVQEYVPQNDLTKVQVLDNMETFSNIRINDFDPAQLFYKSTQSIRSYYTFNDVDVDRYWINGEYTQVFLSARELDTTKTDDSWLIQHLKYTHGYGLTLSRVDRITSSGQPDMLIQSIPPVSEVEEITIERPEIYYGEMSTGYVIVNTKEQEFDYPAGESNVYCEYEGTGGIKLNLYNRILFSIREQSFKLLVSTNITGDSKILINRNISDRIAKIAPFLSYDDDPYVVTVNGKIYWIADGYTVSNKYPYSEPYDKTSDLNYIRNSVKIIVDAYNGDVSFYICDEEDPIVQTLAKIYPSLFKTMDQMPEEFKSHLQYPNALFNIQAQVYERYHMSDVEVFYQNEDRWDIATELYGQSEAQTTANYFIMKLPGEDEAEFVSSISYSPTGKKNLTGVLIARQDGENYGQLVLYRMPKDRQIYGVAQIEAQINQDAEISKEFALWNNSGSTYSRGNMFVIPVEGSLLYVEPVYLYASTSSLPEVKRVIMFYNDKISYQSTMAECLDELFGDGAGDPLLEPYPVIAGHAAAEAIRQGQIDDPVSPDDPVTPDDPTNPDAGKTIQEQIKDIYKQWQELGNQLQELLNQLGN